MGPGDSPGGLSPWGDTRLLARLLARLPSAVFELLAEPLAEPLALPLAEPFADTRLLLFEAEERRRASTELPLSLDGLFTSNTDESLSKSDSTWDHDIWKQTR